MDFEKIKVAVKEVKLNNLRLDCDNNFEAVIIKEEMASLTKRLESFFGAPAFPSKEKLSFQIRQTIDAFGGIMAGQTLYFSNRSNETVFAMLWPWQDGQHTTIKIIKKI